MIEIKQNTSARVAVRLLSSTGTAVIAIAVGVLTVSVGKSNGTWVNLTGLVGADWVELGAGDAASSLKDSGTYMLTLPSSATNLTGTLIYAVKCSGAETFVGNVKVVANEEADTFANLGTVSTNVTGIATDLDTMSTDLAAVSAGMVAATGAMETLADIGLGKWEIKTSGPDANRLVIYRQDGVTVLKKFDLKDGAGDATFVNPFSRTPVP